MSGFSIDSTSMAASFQVSQLASTAQRSVGGVDRDGDGDGSASVGRARGGGGRAFMQSIFQALAQLGLTASNPTAVSATSATQGSAAASGTNTNATGSASGDGQSARHALHAFMHSLFHALRGIESAQGSADTTSAQGNGNASAAQPNYADLTSALQTLLQNVSSGANAPATNGNGSDLQTAFQNLVRAFGTSGSNASPTLPSFLQTLLQDLGNKSGSTNSAALNPSGNVVTTAA
jgi:hypothetical protein